ncbi:hypothetical protein Pmani_024392 [Petrolisthes manimaculis]|uniref:Uncharacterized protein n=1 Tax=Petrolisthes manimaculis TaxID=1843537 RepID=A0AAE1PA88_9EUCA|nr:hypothetical protein Pmani_024392 [Petrolisthes manimaculis]
MLENVLVERARGVAWGGVALRAWGLLVWVLVTVLFVYQAGLNLQVYQTLPTVLLVTMEANPTFRLPPVTACPSPAYDPVKLRRLGINVSGNYIQFEESLFSLRGVPEDLEASTLWQEGSWDFNQVVHYLHTSRDGLRLVQSTDTTLLPGWYHTFSPLGPCLTYNPPIGETHVTVYFQRLPPIKVCTFVNEDGETDTYRGLESQCEKVETTCNSSCGMEDYIYFGQMNFDRIYLYFHESPIYAEDIDDEDIFTYSRKLFDGNYILQEVTSSPNIIITSQLIESSLIKGSCNSDSDYTYNQCYHQFHQDRVMQEVGCSLLKDSNWHQASGQVCRSPNTFHSLYSLEHANKFQCAQSCKRRKFVLDMEKKYESEYTITLLTRTTDVKREVEVKTYPLAQFFSDTGGSLGLFLGVSILTFLDLAIVYAARFIKIQDEKRKQNMIRTIRYCTILLLALCTGVHSMEILRTFLSQPRLTAVSLKVDVPELTPNDTTLIARRLAARALDCHPDESPAEECRAKCLLEHAVEEMASVSPFIIMQGLVPCHNVGLSLPSPLYVVPSEMLLVATQGEKVNKCHQLCGQESHNNTKERSFIMEVKNNHYNFDFLQLACNIGGIIGLYLGYSMFDALDLSDSILAEHGSIGCLMLSKPRVVLQKIHYALKIVVVVMSVVLALWQLHTFLLYHKVSSTTTKVFTENRTEQLAVVMCRWPPLSLSHVASELGINISTRLLYKLPKEERLMEVLRVLDTLPGNWSNTTLDQVWLRAAWNITDVITAFLAIRKDGKYSTHFCDDNPTCADLWQPIITPLNRCFSFNASLGGSDIKEMTIVFPEDLENKGILGTSSQLYLAITPVNEQPLLLDMVAKTAYHRIQATPHQAQYYRLDSSKGSSYNNYRICVHHCLSESASITHSCRLPYMLWRPDLPQCNQEQYAALPRYYKGLEGIGQEAWTNLKNSENVSHALVKDHDKCYEDCRHLQHTFTSITVAKSIDSYPTVVVRMLQEEDVVVQEEDRHTSSQLFSDMGGIAGSMAGFSLMFLLKELLPRLLARRNEQN